MGHVTKMRSDPRGHGARGVLMPPLPRSRTRGQRFDAAVLDVYADVLDRFGDRMDGLDIAVDVVPRMRIDASDGPWPEDVVADGAVPLGRLVPAGVDAQGAPTRPRLIIFRRPVEHRAPTAALLDEWLRFIVAQLVAVYLNTTPEQVDPGFSWD
ncbi:metallopeptidase family protein [Corynebacterium bovis]|uniref:metallopeptidase family protein n=1 Tax=Corynebacterium bovis TaxID=36808 RepID=UPI00244B64BF|nr:metallopeptidase family protein [Corynebacterium bovis]MDH2455521.1 metallopeptidase family protein [Corynebacterium bovis]